MFRYSTMKLELTVSPPLKELIQSCATFCEPACCGLKAFDVNAYVIRRWFDLRIRSDFEEYGTPERCGAEILRQLDELIAKVAAHDGPVDASDEFRHSFGHEWAQSAECITYLQTWRKELVRALSLAPGILESPEPRLAEARLLGQREYYLTVRRMADDANIFLHREENAAALRILGAIAPLNENDATIAAEVKYARKILTEHGARWN